MHRRINSKNDMEVNGNLTEECPFDGFDMEVYFYNVANNVL